MFRVPARGKSTDFSMRSMIWSTESALTQDAAELDGQRKSVQSAAEGRHGDSAFSGVTAKSGRTRRARSTNSWTAS